MQNIERLSPARTAITPIGLLLFAYFFTLHADQLSLVLGGYTVRLSNFIACILLATVLVRFRSQVFAIHKGLAYPLLLIALSMIVSLFLSPYKSRCGYFLGWYGLTVICYVLLPYLLIKLWDGQKVLRIYLGAYICVGLYAVLQLLFSLIGLRDPFAAQSIIASTVRPNAFCYEPSFYALYMTPFVFFYNAYFLTSTHKQSLWVLVGVNALYLISTSTAVSFAYLIFFALLLCLPGIEKKRVLKFLLAFCCALLLLLACFPILVKHFFLKFFFHGFMAHHSFYIRWMGIETAWKVFLTHPWFGVGLGGYPNYLLDAVLSGNSAFSHLPDMLSELKNPLKAFEATSVFTELLASLGLFGLFAFSTLLYAFFKQVKQALTVNRPITYSILLSVAVTLIILQFNQGLMRTYVWAHFALAFAYLEMLPQQKTTHEFTPLHHTAHL